MGLQAPSSFLKWMAEQNFYNILHAFLQMLTTSFLHVEYRKLATYLTTLEDIYRAVARSENLGGGHIVLGGDNVLPLVEIGCLTSYWFGE